MQTRTRDFASTASRAHRVLRKAQAASTLGRWGERTRPTRGCAVTSREGGGDMSVNTRSPPGARVAARALSVNTRSPPGARVAARALRDSCANSLPSALRKARRSCRVQFLVSRHEAIIKTTINARCFHRFAVSLELEEYRLGVVHDLQARHAGHAQSQLTDTWRDEALQSCSPIKHRLRQGPGWRTFWSWLMRRRSWLELMSSDAARSFASTRRYQVRCNAVRGT